MRFKLEFKNFCLKSCIIIFSILMLLMVNNVWAQSRKEDKKAIRDRDKFVFSSRVNQKDFVEKIPFENLDDLIIIPVKIKGKIYHFLFDTGATSVISNDLRTTLSLKPVFKPSIEDASGERKEGSIYILDHLQIGVILFENIGMAGIDLTEFSKSLCTKIDGIIGANLMRTVFWKIDYNSNSLTFSDKTIAPNKDAVAFNFIESFSGTPIVSFSLGSQKFDGIWDSGNNKNIDLPDSIYFKMVKPINREYIKGTGAISQSLFQRKEINTYESIIDSIFIDNQLFTKEIVSIKPMGMSPVLIGNSFMKRFGEVILDWKKKKIYLNSSLKPRKSSTTRSFGFTPNCISGTCTVVFMWENSPPTQQGIQLGDTIVAINGKSMLNITDQEWCEVRQEVKNMEKVKLKISKEGQIRDFSFSKYDLFKKE